MPPILMVPGYTGSGPAHWQTLWEGDFPGAARVVQRSWTDPDPGAWTRALAEAVLAMAEPPVLVAHSLGCLTVARWAAEEPVVRVAAALLVAPPDVERGDTPPELRPFAPVPTKPLPFPCVIVASRDDPYASFERSAAFAESWGGRLVDAGMAGHINSAAGFGPWPEGERLLRELLAG
jgi:uncharacterized protein